MYDVEFLTQQPAFADSILYVYRPRSGALRPQMVKAVTAEAAKRGYHLVNLIRAVPPFSLDGGLFELSSGPTFVIADIGRGFPHPARTSIFEQFRRNPTHRMLMMPDGVIDLAKADLPNDVLIVIEPIVEKRTIPLILDYYEKSNSLYDYTLLNNKRDFREAVTDYVLDSDMRLLELLYFMEEITLLNIDFEQNTFDTTALKIRAQNEVGSKSPKGLIEAFVSGTDDWSFKALLSRFDHRHVVSRDAAQKVVRDLQRSTTRALRGASSPSLPLIYWALLLSIGREWLLEGPLVFALHKICDVFRQTKRNEFKDGVVLEAHWGRLSARLLDDVLDTAESSPRRDLADSLMTVMNDYDGGGPDWANDLRLTCLELAALRLAAAENQHPNEGCDDHPKEAA